MEDFFVREYQKYHNDVYRVAYSYTLNTQDAEDILQKTFLKLYNNIEKFTKREDDYIKKWLIKVTINETKDFLKSFWQSKKADDYPLEEIEHVNLKQNQLLLALNSVDRKYRIPFYLYYYEGYKIKEIAKMMKLSESAIKSRLSRVKDKLKKELEEYR